MRDESLIYSGVGRHLPTAGAGATLGRVAGRSSFSRLAVLVGERDVEHC
jgi:hypothetical protein